MPSSLNEWYRFSYLIFWKIFGSQCHDEFLQYLWVKTTYQVDIVGHQACLVPFAFLRKLDSFLHVVFNIIICFHDCWSLCPPGATGRSYSSLSLSTCWDGHSNSCFRLDLCCPFWRAIKASPRPASDLVYIWNFWYIYIIFMGLLFSIV